MLVATYTDILSGNNGRVCDKHKKAQYVKLIQTSQLDMDYFNF